MTSLFTLVPYYCIGTFQKNKLTGYSSLIRRSKTADLVRNLVYIILGRPWTGREGNL